MKTPPQPLNTTENLEHILQIKVRKRKNLTNRSSSKHIQKTGYRFTAKFVKKSLNKRLQAVIKVNSKHTKYNILLINK